MKKAVNKVANELAEKYSKHPDYEKIKRVAEEPGAICKDHICEFNKKVCCRDCEDADTCAEVCDGMDAKGLEEPCDWRAEINNYKACLAIANMVDIMERISASEIFEVYDIAGAMAVKALQLQEPKLVVKEKNEYKCPKCGNSDYVMNGYKIINNYCGNCGQKLEWDI